MLLLLLPTHPRTSTSKSSHTSLSQTSRPTWPSYLAQQQRDTTQVGELQCSTKPWNLPRPTHTWHTLPETHAACGGADHCVTTVTSLNGHKCAAWCELSSFRGPHQGSTPAQNNTVYGWCAGDWAAVGQLLASQGMGGYYDMILTAETIYNEDSQQRLLDCIKQV